MAVFSGLTSLQRPALQLRAGLGRLVDFVLPPHCLACDRPVAGEGTLCPACWSSMRFLERPFCERLAIPFAYDLGPSALSAEAIATPPAFGRMRAVAVYDEIARKLVQGLKYRDRTDLARTMGRWMARASAELAGEASVVVPVPLHRGRLWRRRFNQAAVLAQALSAETGLPFAPEALVRIRATPHQVGLSASQRAENVRGAFRVPPGQRMAVAGRRVLLVDDVYTTGATVEASTRALLRAGAAAVDVAVFARVIKG